MVDENGQHQPLELHGVRLEKLFLSGEGSKAACQLHIIASAITDSAMALDRSRQSHYHRAFGVLAAVICHDRSFASAVMESGHIR